MVTVDRCEALKKESGIFGGDHNGGDHYNDDENDHYNDDDMGMRMRMKMIMMRNLIMKRESSISGGDHKDYM